MKFDLFDIFYVIYFSFIYSLFLSFLPQIIFKYVSYSQQDWLVMGFLFLFFVIINTFKIKLEKLEKIIKDHDL